MAAENGRKILYTPWQDSACGDNPSRLEAFCHVMLKSLEQVKNEIRQAFDTTQQPSACGEKSASLEEFSHDLIKRLEQVKNEIIQAFDTLWQPSACGEKSASLEEFSHDLIKRLEQVKNEITKILYTEWQDSACGDKSAKLEALYHGLIEWLAQVENEIRQAFDTTQQPSACGEKSASLEEFSHDLIKRLEQVKNEIIQAFDTLWQPSACGEKSASLEEFSHDLIKRLEQVKNEITKILYTEWQDSACGDKSAKLEALYHGLIEWLAQVENEIRAFPGEVAQKELDKTEECKKLKEKIEELEAKNSKLLSKVMSMHKNSENMNDPFRLSAVLNEYEVLRLHEWEKFRRFSFSTYKSGSKIIKKLFHACEKDIQQRINNIFGVLDVPPSNDAMTNSKQEVMQEIRNLFRYSYNQNDSKIYHNIITKAGLDRKLGTQRQFAVQCCKVYCYLLLQDPPVKAVWNLQEMQCLEHVDRKDSDHWEKIAFLWPIMKDREQLIVKGVVWDEK